MIDEEKQSYEERLKQLDAERKEIKDKVIEEKKENKERKAKKKILRDQNIIKINEILDKVKKEIYIYNKKGKVKKGKCDILEIISNLIDESGELGPMENPDYIEEDTPEPGDVSESNNPEERIEEDD